MKKNMALPVTRTPISGYLKVSNLSFPGKRGLLEETGLLRGRWGLIDDLPYVLILNNRVCTES